MSAIRDPAYITDAGKSMLLAAGKISYTKAVLFGQDISHLTVEQIKALTSIGNPLLEVPVGISSKGADGSTVVLEATFQNTDLKADLHYSALGFYAKKDNADEKLIVVGVANSNALLAAGNPDGVATDAADFKVAIKIGDATNVTAVVDPAGSVTPATLNGAVNGATKQLTELINTKASTEDMENSVKFLQDKIDEKADKSVVDAEIAKIDFAPYAKTADVNAELATKADAKTVSDAISKIDFTPYAKTADVDNKLDSYTTTAALTKLLAGKADIGTSYSKAELDKKLLALSTDTSGKVNADQVASMIANKADKTDVDSKIKTVTDLANTKANASDVYTKEQTDAQIKSAKPDLTPYDTTADVDSKLATKANTADVYTKDDVYTKATVNSAFGDRDERITSATNLAKQAQTTADSKANASDVTDIQNHRSGLQLDKPDFNNILQTGDYYISSPSSGKNGPSGSWGNLVVLQGANARLEQIYFPDNGEGPFIRMKNGTSWQEWAQLANTSSVNARLPLSGGQMNLHSIIQWAGGGINDKTGNLGGLVWIGGTDSAQIYGDQNGNDNLDLVFDLGDDSSNHYSFRWNGAEKAAIDASGAYTGTIDWSHISNRPQGQIDRMNIAGWIFRQIQNSNTWNDIFGVNNPNNVLTSLRIDAGGSGPLLNDYAAGVGFGGADTKAVLSVAYQNHQARITGGNGSGPVWSEDIAWKSDINSLLSEINALKQQVSALQTQNTDLQNQLNYVKENYILGKRFSNETDGSNWEKQAENRIAFINN